MTRLITHAQLLETQLTVNLDRPEGYIPMSQEDFTGHFRPLTEEMIPGPGSSLLLIKFSDQSAAWLHTDPDTGHWQLAQANPPGSQPPPPEDHRWAQFGDQPGSAQWLHTLLSLTPTPETPRPGADR